FAYMGIFLFCGHLFEKVATKSLSLGWWGMGAGPQVVEADKDLAEAVGGIDVHQRIAVPGKGEFLYRRLGLNDTAFTEKDATGNDVLYYEQWEPDAAGQKKWILKQGTQTDLEASDVGKQPEHRHRLNVWPVIPGSLKAASGIIWGWLLVAKLIIWG